MLISMLSDSISLTSEDQRCSIQSGLHERVGAAAISIRLSPTNGTVERFLLLV